MSDVLTAWKAKARAEVTLPSGTKVTIHVPDIQEQIIAGEVALPILGKMSDALTNQETLTPEDVAAIRDVHRHLIMLMVEQVEGQDTQLTEADVDALPVPDKRQLASFAMGEPVQIANGSKSPEASVDA